MGGCASQLSRAKTAPGYVEFEKSAILSARLLALNPHLQGATLLSFSGPVSCSLDLSVWTVVDEEDVATPKTLTIYSRVAALGCRSATLARCGKLLQSSF
jgi:hypothetical protein